MSDLNLPKDSATVTAIYAVYKKRGDAEPDRGYLGCSELGHSCERYLWYKFRKLCKPTFDGRMYRLFDTGNWEEGRFVEDLRSIGCTVHDTDDNDNQFAVSALNGKLSGHMDGCALGIPEAPKTWHVLEFKTHNYKSFRKLVKEGVAKSKPQHYCQIQLYMHLSGMTRALYLAVDKDTDELYSERVRYNQEEALSLMDRAKRIIESSSPPERIATREDYYECSWCAAKSICWNPLLQSAEELFGAIPRSVSKVDILAKYSEGTYRLMRRMNVGQLKAQWLVIYGEDIEKLDPIAKYDDLEYQAAEFSGDRLVVVFNNRQCEIREGIS